MELGARRPQLSFFNQSKVGPTEFGKKSLAVRTFFSILNVGQQHENDRVAAAGGFDPEGGVPHIPADIADERGRAPELQRQGVTRNRLRPQDKGENDTNHAATPTPVPASRRRAPVRFITTSSSDTPAR